MKPSNQIKDVLWQLIEKYYNVDRRDPNVLTAKNPLSGNSIDKIGNELSEAIESLVEQIIQQMQPMQPTKESILEEDSQEDLSEVADTILDDFHESQASSREELDEYNFWPIDTDFIFDQEDEEEII